MNVGTCGIDSLLLVLKLLLDVDLENADLVQECVHGALLRRSFIGYVWLIVRRIVM